MSDALLYPHEILHALKTAPAEGLRIAELRGRIEGLPEVSILIKTLTALNEGGQVERDHNGRWRYSGEQGGGKAAAAELKSSRAVALVAADRHQHLSYGLPEVPDSGIPPRCADGSFRLDESQEPIALAPCKTRQVVEAGPGFGKTAVACARVAYLIDQGVPGTQILLLSFTRTAVREMRQRIQELAQSGADVLDICILTIDSWATRLRAGFLGDAAIAGGFDEGIRRSLSLLREPTGDLAVRLGDYRHVLVDEAQDLVGLRAQLIAELLCAISGECGFTVFLDPAQGIYDWAEDGVENGEEPVSFAELIKKVPDIQPVVPLGYLHRTNDPALRRLLLGARQLVLDPLTSQPASALRNILASDMQAGTPEWKNLIPGLPDDSLVLFRRRGSVLDASAWLAAEGIPHRLRLGGLPQPVAPWVAVLLHDAYELNNRLPSLPRDACERAWAALDGSYLTRGWTFERAWPVLRRMAAEGRSRIDVRRVADALLRGQVPDDLHTRELGSGGPILGTVHGSKGREGSRVVFMVPPVEDWQNDEAHRTEQKRGVAEASEARVLYVAISRAKERLDLYDGRRSYFGKANGRDWQRAKNNRIRFEVGREGDLDIARAMVAPDNASRHQRWIRNFDGIPRSVIALRRKGRWATAWELRDAKGYDIDGPGPMVISLLHEDVDRDLHDLLSKQGRRLTSVEMKHLYQLDITTAALRPEHPAFDRLPEPWRVLRLFLAPVVVGLGSAYARKR